MKKIISMLIMAYGAKCQAQTNQVQIVNVTKDTTITSTWQINAKLCIINLNGHKMTFTGSGSKFSIQENSVLMVKNGSVFPIQNWGAAKASNSCIQWRNLNIGAEGKMCNNLVKEIPFLDKM
jgi:hypothetical protein